MKNFNSVIIKEIKSLGYELVRHGKHGDIYRNEYNENITIPHSTNSQKIANNTINRAKRGNKPSELTM